MSGGEDFASLQNAKVTLDSKFFIVPHRIRNVFGGISPTYYAPAVLKLDINLDLVWYFYVAVDAQHSVNDYSWPLSDDSFLMSGCYREPEIAMTANTACDIFVTRMDIDGGVVWAQVSGGTGSDEVRQMTVSPNEEVFFLTGSVNSDTFRTTGY